MWCYSSERFMLMRCLQGYRFVNWSYAWQAHAPWDNRGDETCVLFPACTGSRWAACQNTLMEEHPCPGPLVQHRRVQKFHVLNSNWGAETTLSTGIMTMVQQPKMNFRKTSTMKPRMTTYRPSWSQRENPHTQWKSGLQGRTRICKCMFFSFQE